MKLHLLPFIDRNLSLIAVIGLLLSVCCRPLMAQNKEEVNAPGVNALLLDKDVLEVIITNQLTFDHQSLQFQEAPYGLSDSKFQLWGGGVRATLGVDPQRNFNIGLDVNYSTSLSENFSFSNAKFDIGIGPRFRWRPFGELSDGVDVTMQNFFYFPITDPFQSFNNQWTPFIGNQLTISKYFGASRNDINMVLVGQVGFNWHNKIKDLDRTNAFSTPSSIMLGWFANRQWFLFLLSEYNAELGNGPWDDEANRYLRRSSVAVIPGAQLSFFNNMSLFAAYSHTVYREGTVPGNTFIVGWRMLLDNRYYY